MKRHTSIEWKSLLMRVKEIDTGLSVLKTVPVSDALHMSYASEKIYQVRGRNCKAYSLTLTRSRRLRRLVGSGRKTALIALLHEVFLGRIGLGKGVYRQ